MIASILIFGLVALPELLPTVYPQLRHGTVGVRVISTSGEIVGPQVSDLDVTIASMTIHRVGVGEGAWVTLIGKPLELKPLDIRGAPVSLGEGKVPIGNYNLLKVEFGDVTATIRNLNVTLKNPSQELKVSTVLTVVEGRRSSLVIDLSFDEAAVVVSQRFDPYITVTVEQPGHAPLSTLATLKPLASMGPSRLRPGESSSMTFSIQPGSEVENYLVHAEGEFGGENTFDVEVAESGEFWYDLTGDLWFLGGNLTAGTYHLNVYVSELVERSVGFTVNLYRVPRIPGDLPDATFSGLVPGESSLSIQLNEFALYLEHGGLYDFYLSVKSGDYEFLVDNNPLSVTSDDHVVTMEIGSGLHTFQILTDFSSSGRDTSWSVGVDPAPPISGQPLSREAMLATGLLVVAAIIFVVDVSLRRVRGKRFEAHIRKTALGSESAAGS